MSEIELTPLPSSSGRSESALAFVLPFGGMQLPLPSQRSRDARQDILEEFRRCKWTIYDRQTLRQTDRSPDGPLSCIELPRPELLHDVDAERAADIVTLCPCLSIGATLQHGHCYVSDSGIRCLTAAIRRRACVLHVYLGEDGFQLNDSNTLDDLAEALQANRERFCSFARANGAADTEACLGNISVRRNSFGLPELDDPLKLFPWRFPVRAMVQLRAWWLMHTGHSCSQWVLGIAPLQRSLSIAQRRLTKRIGALHGRHHRLMSLPDGVLASIIEYVRPVRLGWCELAWEIEATEHLASFFIR